MFAKMIDDNFYCGEFVQFPTGEFLSVDTMSQFTLPFQGWQYYETEQDAKFWLGYNK